MKKVWMGTIGVLAMVALVLGSSLVLNAYSKKDKLAEVELQKAQNEATLYKQQVTELEKKYEELKSSQYVTYQAYEEKISELELKLSSSPKVETALEEIPQSDARYSYTLSDNGITITGYKGSDKILVVPQTIDSIKVVAIGREAFKNASFEEVVLQEGLEKIDWFAFLNCTELKKISIPNSVSKIEYGVFDGVKKFTVLCNKNSYAHKYANSYGYDVKTN